MKFAVRAIAVICFLYAADTAAQKLAPLTVEKIMRDPAKWIGNSPSGIRWSEDSKTIYFNWNPDKNASDSLYAYDIASKKIARVSPEQRRNLAAENGTYNRAKTQKVYAKNGDLFLLQCADLSQRQLTNTVDQESDPSFSGDENQVIFKRGNNLFSVDLTNGTLKQWTDFRPGAKKPETKRDDQQRFLHDDQLAMFEVLKERKEKKDAGEKISNNQKPKRPKEIFTDEKQVDETILSPDGLFVTYQLAKPNKSARTTIVPSYVTETGYTDDIPARTKVGTPGSTYEFWIYDIAKDTARKLDVSKLTGIRDKPDFAKDYPKRDSLFGKKDREVIVHGPFWSTNGKNAVVVVRSLDCKDRWILHLDPATLTINELDRQRDEAWIGGPGIGGYPNSAGEVGWISDNLLWYQSEESGYAHLYTVDVTTGKKTALTSGKFEVQKVQLSNDRSTFYLSTNEVHPGEQHFYRMTATGGTRTKITTATGAHEVALSPDEKTLATRYSTPNKPWELYISDNQAGASPTQLTHSTTDEFRSYVWRMPKVTTIKASDGKAIYARVYEPKKSNGQAVIFVHGAGYLQNAHKWWSQYFREYMFHNLLVDKGYTVLDMDYRASSGYGRDWRTGIYRHMGGKDLTDHTDGAKWLTSQYGIKSQHIGIYGGSYGGFITLMALFNTPDAFGAGAALRPVTDWAAYNQSYTANILNNPQDDSLAYRKSSPIYHATGLKKPLLICHGMVDVNVHYQDVIRLSQRLIELGKSDWELASYPMEDHGFVEPSSWTDEYKRILKLFEEKL